MGGPPAVVGGRRTGRVGRSAGPGAGTVVRPVPVTLRAAGILGRSPCGRPGTGQPPQGRRPGRRRIARPSGAAGPAGRAAAARLGSVGRGTVRLGPARTGARAAAPAGPPAAQCDRPDHPGHGAAGRRAGHGRGHPGLVGPDLGRGGRAGADRRRGRPADRVAARPRQRAHRSRHLPVTGDPGAHGHRDQRHHRLRPADLGADHRRRGRSGLRAQRRTGHARPAAG